MDTATGMTEMAHHVLENPTVLGLLVLVVAAGTSISLGLLWIVNKMSSYRNGFTAADRSLISHVEAVTDALNDSTTQQVNELRNLRDTLNINNKVVEQTLKDEEWLKQFHCKVPANSVCRYNGNPQGG